MEFLFDLINSFLPHFRTVFLAIVSLGFLIFIHELGHFYAAKRCGIKVNTFSIGFGPKIVSIQRGETEYKISWLPFGGYVQMEGENPSEQTGAAGEFASASVGSRAFVIAAGPAVNLLFGVLVYGAVFATGLDRKAADLISGFTGMPLRGKEAVQIRRVADDSPGAAGGLMPGDILVSINGDPIHHWSTVQREVLISPNKTVEFVVERDRERQTLFVKPNAVSTVRGDLGEIRVTGGKEAVQIERVADDSPGAAGGLMPGDILVSINGDPIHHWSTVQREVLISPNKTVEFVVERDRERQTLFVKPNAVSTVRGDLGEIRVTGGKEAVQIGWVADDGPGAAGGLMPGDTLVSINGDPIHHWSTVRREVVISPNKTVEFVVERDRERQTLFVKPNAVSTVRGDLGEIRVLSGDETVVKHISKGSLAAEAGLQVGDVIESINGEKLYNVPYFGYGVWHPTANWIDEKYKALYNNINENPEALVLGIRRMDEKLTLEMPVKWRVIASVQKGSIAEDAGIQNGDVLLTLNGETVDETTLYSELTAANQPIEIGLMQDGNLRHVTLSGETKNSETAPEHIMFGLMWQVSFSGIQLDRKTAPLPKYNLFTAFGKGIEATWLTFTAIGSTLQKLVEGDMSPKLLAGPIGIVHLTSESSRHGLSSVLLFIGFISINLAIVNLLPIPIADGGQLLFCAVEKIRGKPMPRKAQEIVQQVSVVLLIAFFLYVTWFDGISVIHGIRN